jgi:cytochrome P450
VERAGQRTTAYDLISMLAHGERPATCKPMEFLGNLILLIVGGNDTTRNSLSGGVVALNENPEQYQKLRDNPGLIPQAGAGDHPLADAADPHAPHRDPGHPSGWQEDQEG